MKLLFVLLSFAAVLYAVAEDEKCFKYGLTSADCNSGEAKIQHLRADSGPPGNDGEKGKPCQSSNGHEALKKALEDSAQSINNNWKRFQDILKMMDQLKNTCVKAANIGQSSGGGNTGGGFTDEGKVKHNNWKYQYFDYSATAIEAWEMCEERGGQLAFMNLLTPDERKKTFKKLKIKENTKVWVNGVAKLTHPHRYAIYLGFQGWSHVTIPQEDFYRRFGFSSVSKSWSNHHATPGCLKCQTSNCRIANGYSETAKVICQYPYTVPASAKTIIPFTQKLSFGDARMFCERVGGQLAFNFLKNKKTLREVLKQSFNSSGRRRVRNLHGNYWIGGYLVDGTANTYRYLDGTSIGDHAKFPWMRPRYPGYLSTSTTNYFYTGNWKTGYRFDKHSFRNHFFRIKSAVRQAMVLQVFIDRTNKKIKYGVKTGNWYDLNNKKFLCEFTKPPGSQYTTDIIGSVTELY